MLGSEIKRERKRKRVACVVRTTEPERTYPVAFLLFLRSAKFMARNDSVSDGFMNNRDLARPLSLITARRLPGLRLRPTRRVRRRPRRVINIPPDNESEKYGSFCSNFQRTAR